MRRLPADSGIGVFGRILIKQANQIDDLMIASYLTFDLAKLFRTVANNNDLGTAQYLIDT